nr:glycosyltransferase [uncultured Carboxylicivirga sp.]
MSTSPVRVLMLFTIMNRGGAETMVMNYFRSIDRSKLMFDFIVHRQQKGDYDDEIKSLGGKIYTLPAITPGNLSVYKKNIKMFFDEHPEYRIIHGHCSELGLWIYKEAHKRNIPFIAAHAHNAPTGWDVKMPFRNLLKHLMRPYLTHFFTCSADSAQWLFGSKRAAKAIFQPNAVNAADFQYDEQKRAIVRKREGWDRRFIIGNVARFDKQKNHLFLVEVVAQMVSKRPDLLCVLIGANGSEYDKVQQRIQELKLEKYFQFYGTRSDIPDLMQGMDVLLFPSFHEGLSVTMIEAQSAGLKIITSTGVSDQVAIVPELVDFLSLEAGPSYWSEHLVNLEYTRKNMLGKIQSARFDIQENALWLTQLYLEAIQ